MNAATEMTMIPLPETAVNSRTTTAAGSKLTRAAVWLMLPLSACLAYLVYQIIVEATTLTSILEQLYSVAS
jgi:hypothetical protein